MSKRFKFILIGVVAVLALPVLGIASLLGWYTWENFPFTSGIIAHASAPTGEEICVVQTFKGTEPYQVSLYARRHGQNWVWQYLAHQDNRWRNCHVEFSGDELRVYTDGTLRNTFSLSEVTVFRPNYGEQLPSDYTPQQLADHHNQYYGR